MNIRGLNGKVSILFSDFGPYHIARIEALWSLLKSNDVELICFRFSEKSDLYKWKSETPGFAKIITLSKSSKINIIESFRIAFKFRRFLKSEKVQVSFLPSYSPFVNALCLLSAKSTRTKIVMMNESWKGTEKANFIQRIIKRLLIKLFDAAIVGGTPHIEYLHDYGMPKNRIFTGYDVVDVNYYFKESEKWKTKCVANEIGYQLPQRFFLNLGRFVQKKNLKRLIEAYGLLIKQIPDANISLLLVGDGPELPELKSLCIECGLRCSDGIKSNKNFNQETGVIFFPFQQIDSTPLFFSKCEAFVLPSMYEEWGLVVNEAMACGVPVIVSDNVGSAEDLVRTGITGFKFNPNSSVELKELLCLFLKDTKLKQVMGHNAKNLIQDWSPLKFSQNSVLAIEAVI
jgi:1,2-diacylglycerol 3-alpha-glucosyltransferase